MKWETSGRGEPLVLLPGGLTGWLSWIPHARHLATFWNVIRLQLLSVELGLAGKQLPPGYSVAHEVASLEETLHDLAFHRADFAGWSYGGLIAFSFAIHYPERVRSLTLIEPSPYWILHSRGLFSEQVLAEQQYFQTLATDDISEALMVAFAHTSGLVPEDMDPHSLPQWEVWYAHRQSLRIGDIEYRHVDDIDLVRTFEPPVLLIKGARSSPAAHAIIDVLAEELPNARVMTLPGGHAAHIESMEAFLALFTRFLTESRAPV